MHSFGTYNLLKEKNVTVQIKLQDNSCGRYYALQGGVITSGGGIHPSPDVTIFIANAEVALDLLLPPKDQLATVDASDDSAFISGQNMAVDGGCNFY